MKKTNFYFNSYKRWSISTLLLLILVATITALVVMQDLHNAYKKFITVVVLTTAVCGVHGLIDAKLFFYWMHKEFEAEQENDEDSE